MTGKTLIGMKHSAVMDYLHKKFKKPEPEIFPKSILTENEASQVVDMIMNTCNEVALHCYFCHIDFDCKMCPCSCIGGNGEWVCRFGIGNGTNIHIAWEDLPFFKDV